MFYWITELWNAWLSWAKAYYTTESALFIGYYAVVLSVIVGVGIGLIGGMIRAKRYTNSCVRILVVALTSGGFSSIMGLLVGALLFFILPAVPLILVMVGIISLITLATIYISQLPLWRKLLKQSKSWPRQVWRRFGHRFYRKPVDHLLTLDESAQAVELKLKDLVKCRNILKSQETELEKRIAKAQKHVEQADANSAAKEIAENVLATFQRQMEEVLTPLKQVNETIGTIESGKGKMDNLISLAHLCRQAGEPLSIEATKAIEAARVALTALIESFARADAALSMASLEVPNITPEMATRPISEGVNLSARLKEYSDNLTSRPSQSRQKVIV